MTSVAEALQQDGQALFTTLYRSWCHNAVAVFSLCLLAQAYEHASNLLYILYVHFLKPNCLHSWKEQRRP